jgi:hypothetical protein
VPFPYNIIFGRDLDQDIEDTAVPFPYNIIFGRDLGFRRVLILANNSDATGNDIMSYSVLFQRTFAMR